MKRFLSACLRRAGKVVQPFFNPDHEALGEALLSVKIVRKELARQAKQLREHRKSIDAMANRVADAQRQGLEDISAQVRKQRGEMNALTHRVDQLGTERLQALQGRFSRLESRVKRQSEFASKVLRRAKPVPRFLLDEQRVLDRLDRLAGGGQPILVGPWTGEVGFELLYWVPFVRWFAHQHNVDPERLIVISRGGTAPWYSDITRRYVDAFAVSTPAAFREATEAAKKQRRFRGFDRALLRKAKETAGVGRCGILHPGLMYQLFMPYWRKDVSLRRVVELTHHRQLTSVDLPGLEERLPPRFSAVRFYFSDSFPDTAANRTAVEDCLESLAEREPIVMLTPHLRVDDHHDYVARAGARIITVDDLMTPENNLAVQTAVISRASRFVGTYGGFSYLAPLYGVDAVAFYSQRNFYTHHLELAEHVFREVGGGSLVVLNVADLDLVRSALRGRVAAGPLTVEA